MFSCGHVQNERDDNYFQKKKKRWKKYFYIGFLTTKNEVRKEKSIIIYFMPIVYKKVTDGS